MKTHLNLATADLEKSILFYSTLLGAAPYKVLPDYALFVTEQPGLELALDLSADVQTGSDVHYGLCVESDADVDTAIARLQETCCYANQTKVWTVNPEGRRWEVYTVHEDTAQKDDPDTTCCRSDDSERSCCVA